MKMTVLLSVLIMPLCTVLAHGRVAYQTWVSNTVPAIVTNTVPGILATTGRYVWDAEHSVCYRLHPHGGFLDLIAVTNINVTLPGNEAALQAIENAWRDR